MSASDNVGVNLEAIGDELPATVDSTVPQEAQEFASYAAATKLKLEVEDAGQSRAEREQNMEARKSYASRIFCLLCVWITAVMATIWASGFECFPLVVSDSVLIALISGVSASVIGLFAIVAGYLFPRQ